MLTYEQLLQQLQSGERLLSTFQNFKNGLETVKLNLQILQLEGGYSVYQDTTNAQIKWLDWFITKIGYKEAVLIHNADYINRRLATYPAIELEIAERRRQFNERQTQKNQQNHS